MSAALYDTNGFQVGLQGEVTKGVSGVGKGWTGQDLGTGCAMDETWTVRNMGGNGDLQALEAEVGADDSDTHPNLVFQFLVG